MKLQPATKVMLRDEEDADHRIEYWLEHMEFDLDHNIVHMAVSKKMFYKKSGSIRSLEHLKLNIKTRSWEHQLDYLKFKKPDA